MEALIVLDVQNGLITTPKYNLDTVLGNINCLIDNFRSKDKPIIFVQHDGSKEDYLVLGTSDFDIVPSLHIAKDDKRIIKTVNSAFYEPALRALLSQLNINSFVITGMITEFCLNASIIDALNHDYDVTVANDAHTTRDKGFISAQQIIEFQNFVWQNLSPTKGSITVSSTKEIIACLTKK